MSQYHERNHVTTIATSDRRLLQRRFGGRHGLLHLRQPDGPTRPVHQVHILTAKPTKLFANLAGKTLTLSILK